MKIQSLKISNFRGVVNFQADLNGKPAVFAGENGTGKSGVIDAIDFLMSGEIRRLTGTGAKDLNLEKHGRHIDKPVEDSFVSAEVVLANKNKIAVKRTLKKKKLELESGQSSDFEAFQSDLGSGQYLLSRRELLKFITCESSKRSEEIQELLDLSEADTMRAELSAGVKRYEKATNESQAVVNSTVNEIDLTLKIIEKTWSARLSAINSLRKILGAKEIESLSAGVDILKDISWTSGTTVAVTQKTMASAVARIEFSNLPALQDIKEPDPAAAFQSIISECEKFGDLDKALKHVDLLDKGLELAGEDPKCPLCDLAWENAALIKHLRQKKENGGKAKELRDRFIRISSVIAGRFDELASRLSSLSTLLKAAGRVSDDKVISEWTELLKARRKVLTKPAEMTKELADIADSQEKLLLYSNDFELFKKTLSEFVDSLPEESPQEAAYKDLVGVSSSIGKLSSQNANLKQKKEKLEIVRKLEVAFESSRKTVFEKLYAEIETDFARFYTFLNQEDESSFSAKIADQGKSVDLKVDFYQRGLFPPNALHSEGHQDSMGICIYLALMKRLKGGNFTIALLDDVMMSIDTNHRKRLCQLLLNEFPSTQFIITTHDRIWSNQLRRHNVVSKKNSYYFRSWSIETGPVHEHEDAWLRINDALSKDNKAEAAPRLRKTLEHEFQEISEALSAKVTFRGDHTWDLGEFKAASFDAINTHIKKAKEAANKWNKKDDVEKLNGIHSKIKDAIKNAGLNEWEINPIIHHNVWENFSVSELKDTTKSMRELINAFACTNCGDGYTLYFPKGGYQPEAFGCTCSQFTMKTETT